MELTKGAIWMLHNCSDSNNYKPTVQILEITELKDQRITRLVINDGEFRNQVIGATSLNDLYRNKQLKSLNIVKLLKYSRTFIRTVGIPVVVVNELEIMGSTDEIIGSPAPYKHIPNERIQINSNIIHDEANLKQEEDTQSLEKPTSDEIKYENTESPKQNLSAEIPQEETQLLITPLPSFRLRSEITHTPSKIYEISDSSDLTFNTKPAIYIEDTVNELNSYNDALSSLSDRPALVQSKLNYGRIFSNKKATPNSASNRDYNTSTDINFFPKRSVQSYQPELSMPVQKTRYPFVNPVMNSPEIMETPARSIRQVSDSYNKDTEYSGSTHTPNHRFSSESPGVSNYFTPSSFRDFSSIEVRDYSLSCGDSRSYENTTRSGNNSLPTIQEYEYTPIAHLYPYNTDWIIKARIYSKSSLQRGKRNKNNLYFKIQLIDAFSDEIEALFSGNTANYYIDRLMIDKVYLFSNGSIRPTDKFRPNYKGAVYQIYFPRESNIIEIQDDESIPAFQYRFSKFEEVEDYKQDSVVDVIGRVLRITEIDNSFPSNPDLKQRKITLTDTNRATLELVLWNDLAELHIFSFISSTSSTVLAIKNGLVRQYKDKKYITVVEPGDISIDPQIPQVSELKLLPVISTSTNVPVSVSRPQFLPTPKIYTIRDIKEFDINSIRVNSKKLFPVDVFLGHIKDVSQGGVFYESCQKITCRKKVFQEPTGLYYCSKCSATYDSCIYRYKLTLKIHDSTDFLWVNAFADAADSIVGKSAEDLYESCEHNGDEYNHIIMSLLNRSYSAVVSIKNLDGKPQLTLEKAVPRLDTEETALFYLQEIKSLLI